MITMFIVVIAALVALNGFFVFIIRTLAGRVGKFAQDNMLRQSSVFDELVMRKEEEYKILEERVGTARARLEALEAGPAVVRPSGDAPSYNAIAAADYKDPDFPADYREIREHFVCDKREKLKRILEELPVRREGAEVLAARRVLENIDAEDVFQLATLSGHEQFDILKNAFDEDQEKLLYSYARGRESFEGFDFISWLRRFVDERGADVVVRTANPNDDLGVVDGRVRTEYDDALCEGMYVMANGKMYDYSIRNKEING
ncbi:MAG: hypothetical protein LBL63_02530 [Clostridiales Family XIII bacterium]|jgi:hypothetical protein|nr:hypothetical protein [Clostridiales Family XIII bacterium]